MADIITLTLNPAVDKSCSVEHVRPEDKLRCKRVSHEPGGGGINVARAVKRLGGSATAVWTCGGGIGELLRERLNAEGIDHRPMPIDEMTRENVIVFEESSDQQYRFGMPGARLQEQEVTACIDSLRETARSTSERSHTCQSVGERTVDDANARNHRLATVATDAVPYLVLSGSLPPGCQDDQYKNIIEELSSDCRVILDTSGPPLRIGVDAGVYLIKPNKRELAELAGQTIENDSQIRDVAKRLIDDGKAKVVVTSLGSGGALLTTSDTHEQILAPAVEIRSKVGAGDSMVAGMVCALSRNKSVFEAAQFGVASGAAAVMSEGTELCRREDVERLYAEME